jgi:hypothetical protein
MNDFVGNTLSFGCFWFLNYHLTVVPCLDEWEHFSTIFRILSCWFFNAVLMICGLQSLLFLFLNLVSCFESS